MPIEKGVLQMAPKVRLPVWLSVGELGKERLHAERSTFSARLRLRKNQASAKSDNDWISVADDLVDRAKVASERGRTQEGWEILQEAQRLEAFGMNKTELADRARALLNEVQDKELARRAADFAHRLRELEALPCAKSDGTDAARNSGEPRHTGAIPCPMAPVPKLHAGGNSALSTHHD